MHRKRRCLWAWRRPSDLISQLKSIHSLRFFFLMHASSNVRIWLPIFRIELSNFCPGFTEVSKILQVLNGLLQVLGHKMLLLFKAGIVCLCCFMYTRHHYLCFIIPIDNCSISSELMSFIFVGAGEEQIVLPHWICPSRFVL